ncbi:hypothetical protein [Longirhabdus pacifica]|uniref:hypothetical protein n=1 Tax=Longirhabdus pacifica TaxID=2305227 RepID=UPI001008DDF5|nr:hypothetical protein [Longirhabdus pacifica]
MTVVEQRLVKNYAILVMGNVMQLAEVSDQAVTLADNSASTLRKQVEIEVAKREIEILQQL